MSKSVNRVRQHATSHGLEINVKRMGESTRTAKEAAEQCGCAIDQIVKSLIFQGKTTGYLYLFLVRGARQLDLDKAASLTGEPLVRADVRLIREITGFAIGGVSPIGHLNPLRTFADEGLLEFETVWSAAGAHDAVFEAKPDQLFAVAGAEITSIANDL